MQSKTIPLTVRYPPVRPAAREWRMSYKPRVLVVEDTLAGRTLLRRILSDEGYRVTAVKDGADALDSYETEGADLIVLDWMLPGMDGLEVIRRIRAIPASVPPYIIMLTGRVDRDDLVTGLTTGADDYLTKPFDRREFVARVRNGVRIQQLMREMWRNNEILRQAALTDPLTELPNRRAFDAWLATERRWPDGPRPFAVILADMDGFKAVNDTYGHLAGDTALREVAQRLRTAVRRSDFVARFGGDEFIAGLPDCNREAAESVADRMREVVSAAPVALGSGRTAAVALTTGLVFYPDTELDDLLPVVDRCLYAAKAARRS
jgi:two-component system chemotaxis response regulator CheY